MKEYEHFYNAAAELDALIEEGMFGENIANRTRLRGSTERNQYLYDCFLDMFNEDQYGLKNMIGITFRLLEMYTDSFRVASQETVDILCAFIKGIKDHPELESMSSCTLCMLSFTNHKNISSELTGKVNPTKADITVLANAFLSSYSKGVELIGKIFTHLLTIQEIINKIPHDLY